MRWTPFVVIFLMLFTMPALAADQINYTSQPDELVVFFNDIAYARDTIALPGGVDVRVILPGQVYRDTLILRENGERVPAYRLTTGADGLLAAQWQSEAEGDVREVTLEYLMSGVGWSPKYDMWLGDNDAATVDLDFFAEIRNPALTLDEVDVRLVAGRVDTSQIMDGIAMATANQYLAGYAEPAPAPAQSFTGTATIQHVYTLGSVTAEPGETVYTRLQESTLPARRLYLWNAPSDQQVTVIYKVTNESELPLAEGAVRIYQDNLFLGSDFVELTPIGSEGSITVGKLQNVRVNRAETQTAVESTFGAPSARDTLHEITLSLSNFGDEPVEIEVVDRFPPYALDFVFEQEAAREGDNVLRWVVTVEPGATVDIHYEFKD
jgi:hypothetical protein